MNKEIWENFIQGDRRYLLKTTMNKEQLKEINSLHKYLEDYLLKNYQVKTVYHLTTKTLAGYIIQREHCHPLTKKDIRWFFSINVNNSECRLSSNKSWSHSENCNLFILIFSFNSLLFKFCLKLKGNDFIKSFL